MTTCPEVRAHLALYAGGDLEDETRESVRGHLAGCPACALELSEYKTVTVLVREAFEPRVELPAAARAAIAREAAERAARHPWWVGLVPLPGHQALAAAVPAFLLVLAVALPLALRSRGPEPAVAGSEPVRIDMKTEGDAVRLAWSDGRGRPYRVYKSTDPRLLGTGPAREVRGNQWVDPEHDSAPVVFYRVE